MWFFDSPSIIFGEDALSHLEQIEGKKCFIVTDPGIIKAKLLDILIETLKETGKEWKIFEDVESDPKEETILKGAKICQEYDPDLIIALGGGSAIDAAKGIWILYERPELQIDDMHPFIKLGLGKKAKMIAIPTTSGTGAETTWAIIVTRIRDGVTTKLEQGNREVIHTEETTAIVNEPGMGQEVEQEVTNTNVNEEVSDPISDLKSSNLTSELMLVFE